MSFDIRLVEEPEEYPADYEPQEPDEPANYRFAAGSIGICLAVMKATGVIDENQAVPEFPPCPPAGIDQNRIGIIERYSDDPEQLRKRLSPDEYELVQEYERRLDLVTAVLPKNPSRVPEFKFLSNDGWLVSPGECLLIYEGLKHILREGHPPLFEWLKKEGYSQANAQEFIRLWAGYNRLAADCGGYRVY